MIQIYHNARCGKSRCALEILEKSGRPFEIVKYLENIPTKTELRALLKKLRIKPLQLVRTKEPLWIENYKDKTLTDTQLIGILVKNPILMERPIVVNGNKAIIGRPPESIVSIL